MNDYLKKNFLSGRLCVHSWQCIGEIYFKYIFEVFQVSIYSILR